jgi:hypothetical protein
MGEVYTVIYLIPFPFGKRDFDRFGVETFIHSGFNVQVWDMTDYFVPDYRACAQEAPDPVVFEGLYRFDNLDAILAAISDLGDEVFCFSFLGLDAKSYPVFYALAKRDVPYATFRINSVPSFGGENVNGSLLGQVLKKAAMTKYRIQNLNWARIRNYAFKLSPFNRNSLAPPALFVVDGARSYRTEAASGTPVDKILKAHSMDYDLYMRLKNNERIIKKQVAVFIDDGFPFHPDFVYMKLNPRVTPDVYFTLLRRFFDEVEHVLGVKVVIAVHPRLVYDEPEKYFGAREMIRGRTAELVRDAELVLLTCSTAVNFAVLFKKPTLFITTDQINRNYGSVVKTMIDYLGSPLLNLNNSMEINTEKIFNINQIGYNNYRNEFIKMDGSPEKYFWEIVHDYLCMDSVWEHPQPEQTHQGKCDPRWR